MKPSDYPPPFSPNEFVVSAGEPEIEVGVLIVGAGPAGLACAIRLGQLLEDAPELAERLGDVPVAVLEKGKQPGSHLLSGAVVNPVSLRSLFEGRLSTSDMPFAGRVEHESVYYLTPKRAMRCGGKPATLAFPTRISPASGTSWPFSRLKQVVLPAPFGPMSATTSPGSSVKDTFFTACTPP